MRNLAVFFGGRSCENEISILTGVFVMNLIDGEKYTIFPLYAHTDGGLYTSPKMRDLAFFKKGERKWERVIIDGGIAYAIDPRKKRIKRLGKIDVALNCCHGGLAEGGGVAALCEWNGIPFASPDTLSSAAFMDKATTKLVMRALKIPTVDYIRVNERDYEKRGAFLLKSVENKLKYPVVVKPARLGSSIGIGVARDEKELKGALANAFRLDGMAIVEKYLAEKRDLNCAVYSMKGEICVSEVEEAFGDGLYTFEEKYVRQKRGERTALLGELRDKVRSYAKTVYKRMNLKGVVRMDFLLSGGKVYLCEVNTVPGSLAYHLFCERISDAKNFFTDLIEEGIERFEGEKKELLTTGILQTVRSSGK